MTPAQVLEFWFVQTRPEQWWAADPGFDERVRAGFGECLLQAARGELWHWRADAEGRLAEIIVLDQFPRNIHRGSPQAFAHDGMALVLAQEAVAAGAAGALEPVRAGFLLMPFMHSESPAVHVEAERLFARFGSAENLEFERRHKAIINRFGRYPHRNAILGRESTPEEREFLRQPGSSF
ncbi:DUF924 family protein [Arenimonas fontis]|uniref:DUF924 domain-containing protein n=1 Tax=Arenimonas fontis TaxID=2608255 RepID=A0A5B2Z9G9_9GAMM|nr:DUF924 family protein [Arenimonas fontis]KAA2284577.1 DUF924 domain-containing protein [Arenimonas fontis]